MVKYRDNKSISYDEYDRRENIKNSYEIRGDLTIIFIRRGNGKPLQTVIDTYDLERAMLITGYWSASRSKRGRNYYVAGWVRPYRDRPKGMTVPLARFLFEDVPSDRVVDHINHDTLDNSRSRNLRIVTYKENSNNITKTDVYSGRSKKKSLAC